MNSIAWLDIAWFLNIVAIVVYGILVTRDFPLSKLFIYIFRVLVAIDAVLIIVALVFRKLIV